MSDSSGQQAAGRGGGSSGPAAPAALPEGGPVPGVGLPEGPGPLVADSAAAGAQAGGIDLLGGAPTPELIEDLLHDVIDPELGIDIVELGLLRGVTIADGTARVRFTVTTPACPLSSYIEDEIRSCLWQVSGIDEVEVELTYEPPWDPEQMSALAREELGWQG